MLAVQPAMADFWGANAPDWSSEANYTNQTWTFTDEISFQNHPTAPKTLIAMPPTAADTGYVNPNTTEIGHGSDTMEINYPGFFSTQYITGIPGAWGWAKHAMEEVWDDLDGFIGGMKTGSFDFYVPITDVQATTSVWVQYISYIPNAQTGSDVGAEIAFNFDFTGSIAAMTSTAEQIHELDAYGDTGNWWRITETWELEDAGDLLFLRVNGTDPSVNGKANIIDSVQFMTATVPVPGALWLLGSGILALVGIRRRA